MAAMNVSAGNFDAFLDTTYKELVGQTFSATYRETRPMEQTSNLRDVLVVEVEDSFNAILEAIRNNVVARCGETVWKGITRTSWGDIWLWVEPKFDGIINAGSTCWFKIEKTSVFQGNPGTDFPHGGVSIEASLMPTP